MNISDHIPQADPYPEAAKAPDGTCYANIREITSHLTVKRLPTWPHEKKQQLVGIDVYQHLKYGLRLYSQPGGHMNPLETNPYYVAIREALEELGNHLYFVLLVAMPQIHYRCFATRQALKDDNPCHPAHPEYAGQKVILDFNFQVVEITGLEPIENDPTELLEPKYVTITKEHPLRACFAQAMEKLDMGYEIPTSLNYREPDFDGIYIQLASVMNVNPVDAHTWSNHHGTAPYQEFQPFGELLKLLEDRELPTWESGEKT